MKGNKKVIEALNDVLTSELTAVNQYFVHYRMQQNWGYERLAAHSREESIGEMKHADNLIERILYLDGIPNLQRLNKVGVGETVKEQLESDLALEVDAIARLQNSVKTAFEAADTGSRELFEHILVSEEEHLDFLETQLSLIGELGESIYLAQQMHKGS
ncbi:MAG: bacterioferritin [Candidatus Binatia bacterium]|jgi:bacterioferritin|nr:bacterioferritin [Candidatus Binatia bacterium]MDG2009747.1 bacterioferritin [Candidatus Binatia bacterium]